MSSAPKGLADQRLAAMDSTELRERVAGNMGLVYKIAWQFRRRSRLTLDDLEQEGSIALMRAAAYYRPAHGIPFANFACACIARHLRRAVFRERRQLPAKIEADYPPDGERKSFSEYACEWTPPESLWRFQEASSELLRIMEWLTERERLAVMMKWGLFGREPAKTAAIGEALGVSRERASQIERRAVDTLRLAAQGRLIGRRRAK